MSDQPAGRPRPRRSERTARRYERANRFPGDRGGGWSPSVLGSTPWRDADEQERLLAREVEALRRVLDEEGEMKRSDLGRRVRCRTWGPGRFGNALRAGVARGAFEHTGLGRYGPAGR